MGHKIESYDISPKLRKVLEWKSARRQQLRQEYLKQIHNPIKQQMILDEPTRRFVIVRLTHEYHTKVTGKSAIVGLGGLMTVLIGGIYLLQYAKDTQEHKYRTGQVSYADRDFKFQ